MRRAKLYHPRLSQCRKGISHLLNSKKCPRRERCKRAEHLPPNNLHTCNTTLLFRRHKKQRNKELKPRRHTPMPPLNNLPS